MNQKRIYGKADQTKEILADALRVFPHPQGLRMVIVKSQSEARANPEADAVIQLKYGDVALTYLATIKIRYENAYLHGFCRLSAEMASETKPLLVTRLVTSGQADALKSNGIQFIDTAGNAYLEAPGVYVFVSGKSCSAPIIRRTNSRLFQPRGLQVIFVCLADILASSESTKTHPVNHLETLASLAGVSVGTASETRRELIKQGYLIATKEGRRLLNGHDLLERWAGAYAEKLYPKFLIQRYRSVISELEISNTLPENALWGGETAAAILTQHMRPKITTLYINGAPGYFATRLGLVADPTGNIELRNMFWSPELPSHRLCVSPLLVYADLLASDEPRNVETAELIHEHFIVDHIEAT
jgi:hypothetical protein